MAVLDGAFLRVTNKVASQRSLINVCFNGISLFFLAVSNKVECEHDNHGCSVVLQTRVIVSVVIVMFVLAASKGLFY